MTLWAFLKERVVFITVNVFLFMTVALFLAFISIQKGVIAIVGLGWFGPLLTSYFLEFMKKKPFYDGVIENVENLDQKYLLSEIMDEPDFLEGKILYDILRTSDKQVHEYVNHYKTMQSEYQEYVEAWVHEIKTPIASSKLIIENYQGGPIVGLTEELTKIEDYIEQALYYARSSSASKDYIVKEFRLKECVSKVIKRNAKAFIHKKIQLKLSEIDDVVYSDEKWVEFIVNQVIINSINYCYKENSFISIYTTNHEHNLILHIVDNGIGIDEKDVGRVFEKGFTGENGRIYRKSTGIGLYLCKMLVDKLHLGITIKSQKDVGTEVNIIFPKSKLVLLES
ncbi:sensor histidine kinase [Bacillus sp. FJAT-27986]|uniref:sensor histidine kinase n=2 Tax=unclassified Bacillus (in: firmicutes) TaxID=185979 RepID=UPI00080AC7C1|nr:sensor histidine kinase [Bacillus sp. FJAT-27986]OCA86937.1 histidine kinase [Bacillus sp. FJAT-27986]